MGKLKTLDDLPEAQQKALAAILRMKKPAFRTSELMTRMDTMAGGHSIGGVVGSLFRNGYLEKVQGGRDKMWKLSDQAEETAEQVKRQIEILSAYWS